MKNSIIYFLFIGATVLVSGNYACTISSPNKQGENLYLANCATCHGDNGEGLRNLYPPLADADYLKLHRSELSCIIKNGMTHPIVVNGKNFHMPMPAADKLNAVEIHNILNYICNSWDNEMEYFTPKEVESQLKKCQ